jgi:ATP synthase protein I
MPATPDPGHDPLGRLDDRLDAFDASRKKPARGPGFEAADGYRLLGQMLGGVLGGIGLGWTLDHYAHTSPFGVVGGLLVGTTLSLVSTIRTATRMSARAQKETPPAPSPGPRPKAPPSGDVNDDDDD